MLDKIKETGIYFIGTLGVAVISFVISLLYTRMFSTDDYGAYSLIAALYSLVYQLLTGWMTHSILRFYPEENERDKARVFRNTMIRIHAILVVIFALLIFFAVEYYKESHVFCSLLIIYLGVFFFEGLLLIFNTFLRAEGNSQQYSVNTILNSVIKSLSIVLLFYVFRYKSITAIVVSLFIAEAIQCAYIFFKYQWYRILKRRCFDIAIAKKVIKFGYPLIGVSVIFNILTYSDRYIIGYFGTNTEVGLYSYGYNMGYTLFYTMTNALMLGAYPRITQEWKRAGRSGAEKIITNYLTMFCYLMIPSMVGIISIGDKMVHSLCGSSYWDCSLVFVVTCISYTLFGFLQYTNKAWELTGKTKMILYLNIIAATINVILNIWYIPKYGFAIAAFTTMIVFLVYIILSLILSRKIFTFRIDIKAVSKIVMSSLIMGVIINVIDYYLDENIAFLMIEITLAIIVYASVLLISKDKNAMYILKQIKLRFKNDR